MMTPYCPPTQSCRLYATRHLRVLLRANAEFFSNWGMELLVTQLYDRSPAVRLEALDVLDEACEDKVRGHDLGEPKQKTFGSHGSLSEETISLILYIWNM